MANEKFHFSKGFETMLWQIIHVVIQVDKKKKIVQFALIFHLFNHCCPMIDYIKMHKFFV